MSHEPIKPLFDDPGAPAELRNFVALARNDGASQAELDRLAKRMASVVGVSAALVASSAAAVGSTAPLAAASSFGAPASGITPALGAVTAAKAGSSGIAVSAAGAGALKAGAASMTKAGLFSQLMASASAKVLAVGLSLSAAGVAVYSATTTTSTTSERAPSGSQVPTAPARDRTARSSTLPGGSVAVPTGESTAAPVDTTSPAVEARDSARAQAEAAPTIQALEAAQPAPEVESKPSVPSRARKSVAVQRAPIAPQAEPIAQPQPAAESAVVDQPVAPEAKPVLPPPSELSLIERAEALRARPSEALAFLAKHEEVYPRGALAQEREVLAIELLVKAGRLTQAKARAEHFEDAYPRSAHLPHLRALLTRADAR